MVIAGTDVDTHAEKQELLDSDAFKAMLALVLQKHDDMTSAEVCKVMWAVTTLKPQQSRSVASTLSNTWLNGHLDAAPLLDNAQMLWCLGSLYSRSNDTIAIDAVTGLLRKCREQIAEGNRNGEDIEKYERCLVVYCSITQYWSMLNIELVHTVPKCAPMRPENSGTGVQYLVLAILGKSQCHR